MVEVHSSQCSQSCIALVCRPFRPFVAIPTVIGPNRSWQRLSRAFGPRGPITTSPEIMLHNGKQTLQSFRFHPNCHRGRIGPGRGCPGLSALVDQSQPVQKSYCKIACRLPGVWLPSQLSSGPNRPGQSMCRAVGSSGSSTNQTDRPATTWRHTVSPG